jgi:hypothetical protein
VLPARQRGKPEITTKLPIASRATTLRWCTFYSFTVLAIAGFGDITTTLIQSRFPTVLEAVTGVMHMAILIAHLTGVYPVVANKP